MADKAAKDLQVSVDASPQTGTRLRAVAGYFADPQADNADRLIYEKIRLGIMSALSVVPSMSFGELRELLQTSDGNLSTHARKLEDAGYIACEKSFANRMPRTTYRLTEQGKAVFARHLAHMEALIRAAQGS